jgi:hypothetical protein
VCFTHQEKDSNKQKRQHVYLTAVAPIAPIAKTVKTAKPVANTANTARHEKLPRLNNQRHCAAKCLHWKEPIHLKH